MKGVCFNCGVHGSAELFFIDPDARESLTIAAELPAELGPLALRYIGLFRPARRSLAWPRAAKLLGELAAMIRAGAVEYYGQPYPASPALFAKAIQQMLETPTLSRPLNGHGYLIKILVGESPKAAAADETAAEKAKQRESQQRHADGRSGAIQQLGMITEQLDLTPRGRAVAALAAEIGRRRAAGEPALTTREMSVWQDEKRREFEAENQGSQQLGGIEQ